MGRRFQFLTASLFSICILFLSACSPKPDGAGVSQQSPTGRTLLIAPKQTSISIQIPAHTVPTPTPIHTNQQQDPIITPTAEATQDTPGPINIPPAGKESPYGAPPPVTALEAELTQQLFLQINKDRAVRGLSAYNWNETLAATARLHSWNMYHCGFSHTCPDGRPQCIRIADAGFSEVADCKENIGYAGPYPTPWQGVYKIHMVMVNEPPDGWHRLNLFSKTLNRIGVGVFVDPAGYIWFTEDMVG